MRVSRWMRRNSPRNSSRSRASRFESGSSSRIRSGFDRQRPGQGDALLLAAGKLRRFALRQLLQPRDAQGLGHARCIDVGVELPRARAVGDVFVNGQVRPDRVILEDHRGVAVLRRDVVHPLLRRRECRRRPARRNPASMRSTVVLPQPEGPSRKNISPGWIANETSSTTRASGPNDLIEMLRR